MCILATSVHTLFAMPYPDGITDTTPGAPWNQPSFEKETAWAIGQVTGGDTEATVDALTEWIASLDNTPEPSATFGAIGTVDLLGMLLSGKASPMRLQWVAQDIRARYLTADYTRTAIDQLVEQRTTGQQ